MHDRLPRSPKQRGISCPMEALRPPLAVIIPAQLETVNHREDMRGIHRATRMCLLFLTQAGNKSRYENTRASISSCAARTCTHRRHQRYISRASKQCISHRYGRNKSSASKECSTPREKRDISRTANERGQDAGHVATKSKMGRPHVHSRRPVRGHERDDLSHWTEIHPSATHNH